MEAETGISRDMSNGARIVPMRRPGPSPERDVPIRADPELRVRIAARLAQRRDAMVGAIVRELHELVPGYWRLRGTGMDADLRSAVLALCDMFIAMLRDGRPLSLQEERMLRALGARRARQGIPIEMLRAAIHAASAVGWRTVVGCCLELGGSTAALATMGAIGDELARFAAVTLRVMSAAYHSATSPATDRAELLAEVLSGRTVGSEPTALAAAECLELRLSCAHALLLVSAVDPAEDSDSMATRRAVADLLAQFPDAVEVPVTWAVTAHVTVAVPTTTPSWGQRQAALAAVVAAHPVVVYAAPPAARTAPLRRAYERGAALLRVARAVGTEPRVVTAADLRLFNLAIEGMPDHEPYLDEVLGPILRLPAKQRDRLLETLTAFRTASLKGGLRAAAKALQVHEKTVAYRTQRIIELTHLDPDSPYQRAQLIVAVDLLTLAGWESRAGIA